MLRQHDRGLLGQSSRVAYRTLRDFLRTTLRGPDGTFLPLGYHEIEVLTEAFCRAVLRELVRLDLLAEDEAYSILQWPIQDSSCTIR